MNRDYKEEWAKRNVGKVFAWGYVFSAVLFVVILSIVIAYV